MKILCIHRAKRFSPNSEQRDALIMDAIQCKLLLNGHHVVSCNEDELHTISNISSFQVIISMARSFFTFPSRKSLTILFSYIEYFFFLKNLKNLSDEDKRVIGSLANEITQKLEAALKAKHYHLE